MKKYIKFISMRVGNFSIALFIVMLCVSISTMAQGDGARFYWKGLMGTNAVPLITKFLGGNANPMDPSHNVVPGSEFTSMMSMAGYVKMLPIGKRAGMVSILFPMGNLSGDISILGLEKTLTARGFGDPMLQFGVNIIGPKAMMNIPDVLRYKPGFSVDLIGSLAVPIGEYDNTSPVNIGQNRWYGRIGAPVVWQIGSWVPGKRTTIEFLPAVWFYSDNNDFVGKTMETEPMFQFEAHLTRDFNDGLWGSFDIVSYSGGIATIDGVEGTALNNKGIGVTLGYHINDNMQMNVEYMSTVNDNEPGDLKIDGFNFKIIYGWHSLIEGMKRLKGAE